VANVDAEETPSLGIRPAALDSPADWGGLSSPFYKTETPRKHVLSMPMETRQAFLSRADQQNAAVGAL